MKNRFYYAKATKNKFFEPILFLSVLLVAQHSDVLGMHPKKAGKTVPGPSKLVSTKKFNQQIELPIKKEKNQQMSSLQDRLVQSILKEFSAQTPASLPAQTPISLSDDGILTMDYNNHFIHDSCFLEWTEKIV